jgi:hypothetical protein
MARFNESETHIELDNFRTIKKVAEFVSRLGAPQTMAVSHQER